MAQRLGDMRTSGKSNMAINTRSNTFVANTPNPHPAPLRRTRPRAVCFEWGMNLNRNVVLARIYVSIAKGFYARGHKGDGSQRR